MSFTIPLGTPPQAKYYFENDLTDETGQESDMTALQGTAAYITGVSGNAISGVQLYQLGLRHTQGAEGFCSFWCKVGTIASGFILNKWSSSENTIAILLNTSDDSFTFGARDEITPGYTYQGVSSAPGSLVVDEWNFFLTRWKDNYVEFYLNGSLVGSVTVTRTDWIPDGFGCEFGDAYTTQFPAFDDITFGTSWPSDEAVSYLFNNPQSLPTTQTQNAPNVAVKLFSWTGAPIAQFYSNTARNAATRAVLRDSAVNGFESFSVELSNDILDPLFTDMVCKIYVDGSLEGSGYADVVPQIDSFQDRLIITGKGWVHKLRTVVITETYTAQTLDFIIKDLGSTYLDADLGVLYDVSNISVPVETLDINFDDKTLYEAFETLIGIANSAYPDVFYRFYVDSDTQEFHVDDMTNTVQKKLFEGYQYHNPTVEDVSSKLVNKILMYRATSADDKATEYVATYSDADSIANYGVETRKFMFSDFVGTTTIATFADAILNRFKDPLTRVTISDIDLNMLSLSMGLYKLANFRRQIFKTISKMESLTGWDVSSLANTTASISDEQTFTNRTSMKLLSIAGSAGDSMIYLLPQIIYSPTYFRIYAYKKELGSSYTVTVSDSFGNDVQVEIGGNNEPVDEWIEYRILINLELGSDTLEVDKDVSTEDDYYADKDVSTEDVIGVDYLLRDGILNVYSVEIAVDSDIAATTYFDEVSVQASIPVDRELYIEEIERDLGKSRLATVTFGDTQESLIDEIKESVDTGETAFAVYSKQ